MNGRINVRNLAALIILTGVVLVSTRDFMQTYFPLDSPVDDTWITSGISAMEVNGAPSCFAVIHEPSGNPASLEKLLAITMRDPEIRLLIDLSPHEPLRARDDLLALLNAYLAASPIPVMPVISMNELEGEGKRSYASYFGPRYYSFHLGHSLFIVLDRELPDLLPARESRWLTQLLAQANEHHQPVFLFLSGSCTTNRNSRTTAEGEEGNSLCAMLRRHEGTVARLFVRSRSSAPCHFLCSGTPFTPVPAGYLKVRFMPDGKLKMIRSRQLSSLVGDGGRM